ncbi:hypothetical protein CROQUDRAFT_316834 [Cronartium quercuum f. sp. fusiforme G11]|uniref:Uncharacterized protein n=1 Tax=Cronartium quercuum f. sp. fusiforme G11 TaxID=708437 RepID=A0A9P6NRU5_9BASI|nr:hypothetical protein CROQUDRAFT_316834 [Cronartium quercuum f. sp. fusiforme G11]
MSLSPVTTTIESPESEQLTVSTQQPSPAYFISSPASKIDGLKPKRDAGVFPESFNPFLGFGLETEEESSNNVCISGDIKPHPRRLISHKSITSSVSLPPGPPPSCPLPPLPLGPSSTLLALGVRLNS